MKKIFILFAVAFIGFASCVESKQVMTVTVTNPLGLERAGEMIEVPMSDVVAKLKLADTAQIVVLDIDGQQVPYQVTYDEKVVFPVTVKANGTATYTIQPGTPEPFNEPDGHWNWIGPKQEGTPATKKEIARAVRLISKEFVKEGIDTEITICEASDYRCMFSTHMTNHERGYEIQSFFCPDSVDTYLGNTPNVPHLIAGHSYWTNTPLESLRDYRRQLRDTLDKYKVDFWQTETCIMGNDEEIGGGGGFDHTMKTALYVARIIHHDIVYAGARSWQWWRAIGGDYKDGLLREYTDPDLHDGKVEDSKLLWILGNYSRFIRPGAVRMSIKATDKSGQVIPEGDTDPQGLMCSAYQNTNGQWVMVVINYADQEKNFTFKVDGSKVKSWQGYRTSDEAGEDLLPIKKLKNEQIAVIPARSVITFVSQD